MLGYQFQSAVISKVFELNNCKCSTFVDLFQLFPNLTNFFNLVIPFENDTKNLQIGNLNLLRNVQLQR
jgi:hypothetical protein